MRLRRSRSSACSPEPLCETTAAHAWSATALRGAKWHCTLPASGARYAGAWPQNRTPHYASVALATDVTHGCSGASRQRCGSSTRSLSTRPTLSSSRATFPPRRRKLISTAPKASSSKQVSKVAQYGGIVELSEGSYMHDSVRLLYLLTYLLLTKATGSPLTGTTRSPRRSSGATACGVAWRWARLEPGDGRACRPSWSSTRRERRWRFCRPNGRAPARLPGSRASGGAGPRSCDEATYMIANLVQALRLGWASKPRGSALLLYFCTSV